MGSEILVVKDSITSIRDVHEAFQAETKAETEALTLLWLSLGQG